MKHSISTNSTVARAIGVACLSFAAASAGASVITVQTSLSNAPAQASAAAYKSIVEAAVATPTAGYGKQTVAKFDNLSNGALFGANSNVATEYTVDFVVSGADAGAYQFRFGVDFGRGGAVFMDNVQVALNTQNMWWSQSYANQAQYFLISPTLQAGKHTIQIFGLEDCCDGSAQGQYKSASMANFATLSATDGMSPSIPEPASVALFGLAAAALVASRRKQA